MCHGPSIGHVEAMTTGKFYAAGNFGSSRAVVSGDSLLVTATFGSQDDGV